LKNFKAHNTTEIQESTGRFTRSQLEILIFLTLLYIWLSAGLSYDIRLYAIHDDALQMDQATSIVRGGWLGHYDNRTLVKGSFFPLLMVFCFYAGIPLLISMPIFYSLASLSFIKAIQPAVKRRWPLVAAYALLLFNPAQYSSDVLRVYRDGWNNCILLLLLSGVAGLICRRNRADLRSLLPWSAVSGIAAAAFWDTREEAVWILPVILGLSLLIILSIFRSRRELRRERFFVLLGLPIFLWFLGLQAICFINWRSYGAWTLIETRSKNYEDAVSLLSKARTDEWRQYIACPLGTREKLYTASPAFAELRPFLEGNKIALWKMFSEELTGVKDEYGTHFVWALRDAVAAAGYYENAASADAFYARLASELKVAYQKRIIEKEPGIFFGGLGQPFNSRHIRPLFRSLRKGVNMILKLDGWNAPIMTRSVMSGEGPYLSREIRQLGNINMMPSGEISVAGYNSPRDILDKARKTQLIGIAKVYAYTTRWLVLASFILLAAVFIQEIRRRRFSSRLVLPYICVMMYGVSIVRLVLLALLEAVAIPGSTNYLYMSPAWVGLYGAMAVCIAFSCDMLPIWTRGKSAMDLKLHFKGSKK
jgi:hypothetical protein